MNTSRTIEQLEAEKWAEPSSDAPPHVHRCHELRRVPIERLTAADLRVLVGQDIGLKHLVPITLGLLKTNPMLLAEHYPGDLLAAAMRIDPGFWSNAPRELAALNLLAEQAQTLIAGHPESQQFRQVGKDITRFQAQSAA